MNSKEGLRRPTNLTDPSFVAIVSSDKMKDLLANLDPEQRLDNDVEDILMDLAAEFITTLTKSACMLAKHRGEELEAADGQLIAEKNYGITVPGFGSEAIMKAKVRKDAKSAVIKELARKAGIVKRTNRAAKNRK